MQLPLENWAARAEEERVRPGRKPRVKLTALSAADQERVLKLIQVRNQIPSGPEHRKLRTQIACKIYDIKNPWHSWTEEQRELSNKKSQEWADKNRIRRREIALSYYYRHRPPLKQRVLLMTPLAHHYRN